MKLTGKGEKGAFEVLYERYFDKLTWFARQYIYDEHHAQDVAQEVFIKIIEQPHLFDQQRKFSTWAYTVVANRCKNVLRDTKNRAQLLDEQPYETHTSMTLNVDHNRLRETIRHAYARLNEKEKALFVLRFEHDLPLKEIAEITDSPQGTVKSGIHYLLKKMAQHLKAFTHE